MVRMTRGTRPQWTAAAIADLSGRTAVVTGANGGLGYETARMFAEHGAAVVMACRDLERAAAAAARIRERAPQAQLRLVELDLLSLASVRRAAEQIRTEHAAIDLLVNNAGAAYTRRTLSADGFESTFATNHLGPFALTGLLIDRIAPVAGARIVSVASVTHRWAHVDFDDLHFERRTYRYLRAYGQSKLANLLFTFELQRLLSAAGAAAIAVAAHPGGARTNFTDGMGPVVRSMSAATSPRWRSLVDQSAADGALPTVRAAVDPGVAAADFYGPSGLFGLTGAPVRVRPAAAARDRQAQRRLWRASESATGITFPL